MVVGHPDVAADHLEVDGADADVDGRDELAGDGVDARDGAVVVFDTQTSLPLVAIQEAARPPERTRVSL